MIKKKMFNGLFYYITFIYLEIIFKVFCTDKVLSISLINTLIYLIPVSLFFSIITSSFKEKTNNILSKVLLAIITVIYGICLVFKLKFGIFFSINSVGLANQLISFATDTLKTIGSNFLQLLLLFIPFISSFILKSYIDFSKKECKTILLYICYTLIAMLIFIGSLFINKNDSYSSYKLYCETVNHQLTVERLGVLPAFILELKRKVIPINENINEYIYIDENTEINNEENIQIEEVKYNNINIDFDELSNNTNNKKLQTMNEYFKNEEGTKKNKYTGLYKGKNLIVFMAESFNSFAISEELTPTLYKLSHEGFVFENFYSPVILSTIGGEFQELTGLYPHIDLLSNVWRKGSNYYPYGLGTVFNNLDYNTFAYHDNQYNFQSRDKYLKSIGFNNYIGCWNGLEKKINCNIWPESDLEMINATVDDYINSDKPFMTYYVTVSGHMSYDWYNAMSSKHKKEVDDLPYSIPVKAYIATQIELDLALESLINELDKADKLNDTVIALVGDHYPYDLTIDQINEASTYKRDNVIEINHSNFILWNNQTETTNISKVGSQIDVLPTLLNLFEIDYDSRLIIGKDILSDTEGLAIFSNNSWISDKGKYFSSSNKFVSNNNYDIEDDYVQTINKTVTTKINMSRYILENNYYKYVFNK